MIKTKILYKEKTKAKADKSFEKYAKHVRSITEGFARGIARYIMMNYDLPYPKISNGFTKLWEILNIVPDIVPKNKFINIF